MSEEIVLKCFSNLNKNKTSGSNNLSGKFLKDTTTALAKSIFQLCNLPMKYSISSSDCKITKLKPLFKKGLKIVSPKIMVLYPSSF